MKWFKGIADAYESFREAAEGQGAVEAGKRHKRWHERKQAKGCGHTIGQQAVLFETLAPEYNSAGGCKHPTDDFRVAQSRGPICLVEVESILTLNDQHEHRHVNDAQADDHEDLSGRGVMRGEIGGEQ